MSDNVVVIKHNMAQAILTRLRDRNTGQVEFRSGLIALGRIIGYEIVNELEAEPIEVETPLGVRAMGIRIPDLDHVVIVQILRAAMPLAQGLVEIFSNARVGVVSAKRVESSHVPGSLEFEVDVDYVRVPKIRSEDVLIVADPMLATGSTIVAVLDKILTYGSPKRTIIASVIGTEYGIRKVRERFPDVKIYAVALDPALNEMGYIVPGLGDAGDRAFGSG